jgi:thiosulfate dehydrogenase [quinone] large subunit
VKWGHFLIGLSLVSGLLVRVSGVSNIALLLIDWRAHVAFPYIDRHVNLIIDFHIVFAALTAWLVAVNAGRVYAQQLAKWATMN